MFVRFRFERLLTLTTISFLLVLQIIVLRSLYISVKDEFILKVNVLIETSTYNLNALKIENNLLGHNWVSFHPDDTYVVLKKNGNKTYVSIGNFSDKTRVASTALYDIRDKELWNLKVLDSIFQAKCKEERLSEIPIEFRREDSTGYVFDRYISSGVFSKYFRIKSEPVRLGFLDKHLLKADFIFPFEDFCVNNWDRLIMILGLTVLLGGCILNLYYGICQERKAGEYRERFIHALVHDLKTPVQLIRKDEYLLRKSFGDKENVNFVLMDRIREDLDTLSAKIDSLLTTVTKNEGLQVCLREVDLKEWIEHLVYLHQGILPEGKRVRFRCEVIPESLIGRVDADHLYAALSNLLDNAVKYSGESVTIEILLEQIRGNLVIRVKDNGFGIREEDQKYIFMKNFRGKDYLEDATRKGYGLGLYYVSLVVAAHRGKIKLISKPGVGSEFIINIPQK